MATETPTTVDEPVDGFTIDHIFMSRTDTRGVIQSGNMTLKNLAGFEWSELIGAPHKIIRHPDMPRAAFHALWATLQSGQPFGAYVKNRAKNGRYYWVFAVAVPIRDGYLSVRIKPSSPLLETVAGLYGELLRAERDEGQTPEDGAAVIEETVQSLGFRSYTAFMGYALGVEFTARCKALNIPEDPTVHEFEEVGQLLTDRVD